MKKKTAEIAENAEKRKKKVSFLPLCVREPKVRCVLRG
jgi:hypothetical protein